MEAYQYAEWKMRRAYWLVVMVMGCGGGGSGVDGAVQPDGWIVEAFRLSPGTHDFGTVAVGETAEFPFTVHNRGLRPSGPFSATVTGEFEVRNGCDTLQPDQSCVIWVIFAPKPSGP